MKRNLDLVRDILLHLESQESGFYYKSLILENYSKDETIYHIILMIENELIDGNIHPVSGNSTPLVIVTRMTWKGHDFLEACRDNQRWKQAKEVFANVGGVTFEVAKDVLVQLMMKSVSQIIQLS